MKNIISLMLIIGFMFFSNSANLFASDDDMVVDYPDGDFGIDIGGGYEAMPSKSSQSSTGPGYDLILPEGYRESYKDTKYGPMTQRGFVDFPGFTFSDVKRKEAYQKKKKEEREKEKELIFHETTTKPSSRFLWGVSSPK